MMFVNVGKDAVSSGLDVIRKQIEGGLWRRSTIRCVHSAYNRGVEPFAAELHKAENVVAILTA